MSLNPFSLDIMTSPGHPIYQGCDNYDYSGTHMGDRKVVVTLQSATVIDFMIGDYITYNGEKFTLQTSPITTRIHSSLMLAYTLTFWWNGYELQLANFLDVIPSGDDSAAYYNTTSEVIINDTISVVCGRIIVNLDRSGYTGWTFDIHGSVDVTTKKDIEAINVQCYDVLQNMATVFGVEYRFDNATKTIWIGYPPEVTTLFEYGKDKGICEINRVQNDQKVITRVRGFGSTRNISANYRKDPLSTEYHPRLMLPDDQVIDARYSIINGYLVDIIQEAAYGIREGVPYINEDIYPTIEGLDNTIKAVGSINDRPTTSAPQYNTIIITPAWSEWVTSDWKGFPYAIPTPVEIVHPAVTKEVLVETVSQGAYDTATFFVANLGIDLNDESIYTGTTPKIAFTSGNMSGIEFEIAAFTKYMTILNGQPTWDDGFGHQYYKVTVVRDSSDANHILPSAEVPINVGDTYAFLNIFLPDTYENAAEARVLTDTMKYLVANTKSPEGYAIRLAEEYFTKFPLTLGKFKEGNAVTIRDTVLGLTERAVLIQSMSVSYKDNALLPTYNLTISDVPIKGSLDALRAGLKQSNQTITSRINNVESNTNSALKSATILTSRILDNNLDIRGSIIAAQSIEPVSQSIELKSAHYILQALFKVNYEGAINAALGTEGVLIHKEADVVWDNTYDLAHQTWTIATPQNFSLLDGVMYYVYIKGSLIDGTAIWVVSETKIPATSEQDYYYFEWGQVLAPIEGIRITQTSYGSTYVTHLPVTVNPASAAYGSIVPETQVLTINAQSGTDVVAGNGMDFITNTDVTLGTPSTVDSDSINEVTTTSHTHELGNIALEDVISGTPVEYGALYNWYAATDARGITSSDDWILPTYAQTEAFTMAIDPPYGANAGGKLKETGYAHWSSPNTGATNELGFNMRGGGWRDAETGYFSRITLDGYIQCSDESGGYSYAYLLGGHSSASVSGANGYKGYGYSIRLLYTGTGTPTTYTGNDGKVYPVVLIGTQYWVAANLNETKYRDGSWIHGYDGGVYTPIAGTAWVALTTEGMCYFNDNEAYGGGETPLSNVITQTQHNSFQGLNAGDYQHLTAAELVKVQSLGVEDIAFEFADVVAGTAKDYTLDISASFGYTIESACLETDNGTLTGVAVKIGSTAVTSLSSVTVDTAVDETASTGANTVVAGNRVWLSVGTGYTGTPTLIRGKLKIART